MNYKRQTITLLLLSACFNVAANEPLQGYIPIDVKNTCSISTDDFEKNWANINLPKLGSLSPFFDKDSGIVYIFPANGPNFDSSDDCAFFEWSSQMFLWLTSTVNDVTSAASASHKKTGVNTPYVFSSEFFYRLENDVLVPQDRSLTASRKHIRVQKSVDSADSTGQAGGNGVLFTHANTDISNSSSLVYYEMLTNRSYGYVTDAVTKNTALPNNFSEFVSNAAKSCQAIKYGIDNGFVNNTDISKTLYSLFCPTNKDIIENEAATAAASSISIPDLETAIDFLSMNMEVKTAWVDASTLKHPENYITQKGSIPIFTQVTGENKMINSWNKNAVLALVGMHVVGSVKDHPEMIWATFEHKDNAPNSNYYYINNMGKPTSHSDLDTQTNNRWLLSNGTHVNNVTEFGKSETDANSGVTYIVTPDKSKPSPKPVSTPSNVNRLNPWGTEANKSNAKMNTDVISTNISVLKQLEMFYKNKGLGDVDDPRFNYILTGASWGAKDSFPTGSKASEIAGTPAMANTTMETFQQSYTQKDGSKTGCFSCHGIEPKDNKFDVSHIFKKIKKVQK